MPVTGSITLSGTVAGISFSSVVNRSGGGQEAHLVDLPAGNAGSLTTRTDNDTGVATLAAGHTIENGDIVDVYWDGGKRIGMTASVSSQLVTLDGGAGDNLPAADTDVIVSTQVAVDDVEFDGDSMEMLAITCDQRAAIAFVDDVPYNLATIEIGTAREIFLWAADSGVVRPITGNPVAAATASNGSITAATLKLAVVLTT